MNKFALTIVLLSAYCFVHGQIRHSAELKRFYFDELVQKSLPEKKVLFTWLVPDKQQVIRYSAPIMMPIASSNWRDQGHNIWVSNVTSQSFNNGRFGTYYYWDIQGNLRGSRAFIDLSGKSKRGWKLVFPTLK